MAKKTNKTSHVMDLLTNGASPETGDAASSNESGQDKKSDVQSHTVSPSKVTVVDESSRNDRLSQEILNNLSKELEEETHQSAPAPAVQIVPEAAPAVQTAPEAAPAVQAAPEVQAALAEEEEDTPANAQPHHAIIPKSQLNNNLQLGDYHFVNVMEQLMLRQNISNFQKQYNVCTCKRCTADVCALALSGLPPKYVVTRRDSLSPLLSYYESKYKIFMLTEIIKACNQVRENPRHKK